MDARSTFREKCPTICWQKSLRDKYNHLGTPNTPHLDIGRSIVKPISRRAAEQVIVKYEWLGRMFGGSNRFYGIFFGSYCAGVTTFAVSGFALPSLAKLFRIDGKRLAYLARGACVHWAPAGCNSKLISWSCRFESKRGSKLAIAFSDTDAGEIGTVYQASNWTYIGIGDIWRQWVSPLGKIWSFNTFTQFAKNHGMTTTKLRERLNGDGWREQDTNRKHRYVMILDRNDSKLISLVESLRKPYPKRAGSDTLDTLANHAGKGGSLPTPALHS